MELFEALRAYRERILEEDGDPDGLPDKKGLIADFRTQRDASRVVGFHLNLHLGEAPKASTAPLSSLQPILLRDLTVGRKHHGFVLYGVLIEVPFKTTPIKTIVEDGVGDAIAMAIYRAVEPYAGRSEVENLYPRGMRVAVKEPYFKVDTDKRLVVQVDNPADVIDWVPVEEEEEVGNEPSEESVESLRELGKRHFSEAQWYRAIGAYSRCIRLLEAGSDGGKGGQVAAPTDSELFTILYSNRAEAWLRVDHHANALHDAVKALEHDASHTKSMVRRVRALCGLQCYQEAISCLRDMLKRKFALHPQTRSELKVMLKEAEVGDKQCRLGLFNLNEYYRSGSKESAPACSDYVGSVEVRMMESAAAGRGLFATKQVKAGDLLVASNPLAVSTGGSKVGHAKGDDRKSGGQSLPAECSDRPATRVRAPNTTEDLITKLVQLCRTYPRRRQQLYSLSDTAGDSRTEAPPMSLFTPPKDSSEVIATSAEVSERAEVDVGYIRRLVKINSFQGDEPEGPDSVNPSGLWVLPSFVNHSCLPNAKCSITGEVLFLRATRDIAEGEEITILYCWGQLPVLERGKVYKTQFHFECRCVRCCYEKSLTARFPKLAKLGEEYAKLPAKDTNLTDEETSELAAVGADIARQVEEVLQQVPEESPVKKQWVRASFLRGYMCQVSEQLLIAMKTCGWEDWAECMSSRFDIMLSIGPDEEVLAHVAGAIHHLPVAKHWRAKWNMMARNICTLMYGPLDESSLTGLVKRYSRVSSPL